MPIQPIDAARFTRTTSLILVLIAGLLWSIGGVLVRLVEDASGWQIIFYRSVTQTIVIVLAMLVVGSGSMRGRFMSIGRYGIAASIFLSFAFIFFVFSILHTNVANTLLILSTVPFISAFLGFVLLRERPGRETFFGAIAAAIGVGIMVGQDASATNLQGNIIAIFGAMSFASYIVCMRGGRSADMLPANAVGGVLSAVAAAVFAATLMEGFAISLHDLMMCIGLGVFQTGLGLITFTLGSRQLKASELALLSLIHVILGPVWVLVLVGEVPGTNVLVGGALVLAAIVVPAARQMWQEAR